MIKNSQNRPESSGFGAKTVQKKSIISLKKVRKRSNIGQRKGTKSARKESKKFQKKKCSKISEEGPEKVKKDSTEKEKWPKKLQKIV